MKKVKKKTLSQLKKDLDKVFSLYIRNKYAKNGIVTCYTCGAQKDIKEIQCGHFVSRSSLSTRFLEDNCRPQCVGCNVFGGGKIAVFANRLEQERPGAVAQLYRKGTEITKWYPKDYQEMISYYKQKLDEIKFNNKGYE